MVATFAFTNGLVSTMAMVTGPQYFSGADEKGFYSNMLVLMLMAGLSMGAVFGLGVEQLILL